MESFAVDGGLMLWTLLTFAALVLLLARFAFRPLKRILEERERGIRESVEAAEQARNEARKLVDRNEQQLNQARDEARRIIGEGHRIVADMKQESHKKAKEEADLIAGEAREQINREMQRSVEELKTTVVSLSVQIASQVIRARLDEKEHEALADEFIDRLKKSYASRPP